MKWNGVGIACLVVLGCCALFFVFKGGSALYTYYSFSVQVPTTIEKWSIEEIKSNQFVVVVYYAYTFEEQQYQNVGRVGNVYPNPWAATQAQKHLAKTSWPCWINPHHPDCSTLQKKFPFKKTVSAGVILALFFYFIFLGTYVGAKHG